MGEGIGRRSVFFAVVAVVCVAIVPATPPEFKWVAWAAAALAALWAIVHALEDLSVPTEERARPPARDRSEGPPEAETPFGPPPFSRQSP